MNYSCDSLFVFSLEYNIFVYLLQCKILLEKDNFHHQVFRMIAWFVSWHKPMVDCTRGPWRVWNVAIVTLSFLWVFSLEIHRTGSFSSYHYQILLCNIVFNLYWVNFSLTCQGPNRDVFHNVQLLFPCQIKWFKCPFSWYNKINPIFTH